MTPRAHLRTLTFADIDDDDERRSSTMSHRNHLTGHAISPVAGNSNRWRRHLATVLPMMALAAGCAGAEAATPPTTQAVAEARSPSDHHGSGHTMAGRD